jgi:hypothetical protein
MHPRKALAAALTSAAAVITTLSAAPAAHAGYPFPYSCSQTDYSNDMSFDGGTIFQNFDAYCVNNYELVMRPDGSLVEYNIRGQAIWSTQTYSNYATATFQTDGNLVVYASGTGGNPLWSSNSWGNYGATLWLQQDGNLVIYASYHSRAVWASGTNGR